MHYLVKTEEMKRYDQTTIEQFGMPGLLLMERAALFVAQNIQERFSSNKRILIVAGTGNNGGDGIAAGRILWQRGYQVTFFVLGNKEKYSEQTQKQLEILKNYKIAVFTTFQAVYDNLNGTNYDIIVDALLGIGITKPLTGVYEEAVRYMNHSESFVVAVDIASGIDADTGKLCPIAVKADLTVTFAFRKRGHYLEPGVYHTGELVCGDIGITEDSFLSSPPKLITYEPCDIRKLPKRIGTGNKGTFGKVLLIAGSKNMSGACELSAKSIFRTGAGMVKIFTVEENREIIQRAIPEAMLTTFQTHDSFEYIQQKWLECANWADCIAIGPGMGTEKWSDFLLECVFTKTKLPVVVDADALNCLAKNKLLQNYLKEEAHTGRPFILTPHVVEFSRISGYEVSELKQDKLKWVLEYAMSYGVVLVCKDAKTAVYDSVGNGYLNTNGNDGMATAGSGDVLTGIITGLLAQGMDSFEAAKLGVYLHACAGDSAANRRNPYSLMASDLVEELNDILAERTWLSKCKST